MSLAFCWSHARRKFYELAQSGPADRHGSARAHRGALSGRSRHPRPLGRGTRAARQASSRPIVAALEPWLEEKLGLVSQKSKLAEAICNALSRWQGLARFLHDGRVEIASNVVERAIRPIALNRKNALFAGSDDGGEHWALIASLVETCKLVDPQPYLGDVIARIVAGRPQSQIDDLLPWAYAPQPLKAVA